MSSLLRSSIFARYFGGFARSLVFNHVRGGLDVSFVRKFCLTSQFSRSLETRAVTSQLEYGTNLERSLKRLDNDVRRIGRISRRELEEVLEELRHTRSATSTQSLLIIRCCGSLVPEELPEVRTQLVKEVWKTLENLGVAMDVSHYNALLRVYLENEHHFSPTEFLANLEQKGVEPNRVTYQRLISRYCQDGDIEGATRILEFMREKLLPVNESVFNSLIMGHSQADDMESAAGILQVMSQAGLEPSNETYTTLLCGYAKRGDMEAITRLLEECESRDILLLDKDYMDVIYTLAISGHSEHVDQIISKLRQMAGYNQDAVSLILRLVNAGCDDIAMKILQTMRRVIRDDGVLPTGTFLVRQLVRVNRPVEKIVEICLQLERDGLNPRALSLATESSLMQGNIEQSTALLTAMQKEGHPIRQHYFWPQLVACGKKGDKEGLLQVLRTISMQFDLFPGGETLRDYTIPYLIDSEELTADSAEPLAAKLHSAGISSTQAFYAIVYNLLLNKKPADAVAVASRISGYYPLTYLQKPLTEAFRHTLDTTSFVSMVYLICRGAEHEPTIPGDEESQSPTLDRTEIAGQLLLGIAQGFRRPSEVMQQVLEGFVNRGISISTGTAEKLQEKLGAELTSEISSLLSKVTSGELVLVPLNRILPPMQHNLDEKQLKSLISEREVRGEPVHGTKRQLLLLYIRNRDLENAELILKDLEADEVVINPGTYSQMIELYILRNKLEEALTLRRQLQANDPNFLLDDSKTIKLATLLVDHNKIQDALQLLKDHPQVESEKRTFVHSSLCWRLLNSLALQGRVDEVKEMFQVLMEKQFVDVTSVILGPLIKVHLVRDDPRSALAAFEECCEKYRFTPWKNELICKLIQMEDVTGLQHLTDLNTKVHGEINSLYDLVFGFVECGRIRQARKILETPGLRSRPERVNFICTRYRQEGNVASLEALVEATKDLSTIDRSDLFHHLLLSYCEEKDVDKALGLWMRMQEEDVPPSDEFLVTLGNFLIQEGREVPFAMPDSSKIVGKSSKLDGKLTKPKESTTTSTPNIQQLRQALRENEIQQALEIKQRLDSQREVLTARDISALIEGLVKKDRLAEASKLLLDMLADNLHPSNRVLRFLINRLAVIGEAETLVAIGKLLDGEKKKLVLFNNRLCQAYIVTGQAVQYLESLEKDIDNVTKENLVEIEEKFPKGGALGLLQKHPEIQADFERVARKYAKHGSLAPINVLWMYLIVAKQHDAAEKLWEEFLQQSKRLMFQYVMKEARINNDVTLAHMVVDKLKKMDITGPGLGVAYSCLLDVLVSTGKPDEALKILETALKDVSLESINNTALRRLQIAVTEEGKTFPYDITQKHSNNSSTSSSSSDDESIPASKQAGVDH